MRYLVLRIPDPGPPALAGGPNNFDTLEEAIVRMQEIRDGQTKDHHTSHEVRSYVGDNMYEFMDSEGIMY